MSRIPRRHPPVVAVLSLLLSAFDGAGAESVTLSAARDNTLYEDAAESNGAGAWFFAGRVGSQGSGRIRRGLLAFDLAAIPSGATLTGATLTLRMSRTPSGSGAQTVSMHRVLADWGEGSSDAGGQEGAGAAATAGDATWTRAFTGGAAWAVAGGDFATAASASQSVSGAASYTWSGAGLVADLQAWVDDPASNFGWAVIGNEGLTRTAKRFDSRQNPTAANRPQLTVEYSVPTANRAPVVAAALADLALVAGAGSATVSLGAAFTDADGDALTFGALSSATAIATVAVSGSSLQVTPLAPGTATVTVTATDPDGASASAGFQAVVAAANAAPVVAAALPDTGVASGDSLVIDLSAGVFADPNGDDLAYAVTTSDSTVARATVVAASLTVRGIGAGTAAIAVTATDPEGASASDGFAVAVGVANRAPVVVAAPSSQWMYKGFESREVVDFDLVFDDPDGDALAYAATAGDSAVVSLATEDGTLRFFGACLGTTTIAVTATDPAGASARVDIAVEVLRMPGDFDANGAIDFDDFFALADHFGLRDGDPGWDAAFDMSKDGVVDFDDFFRFADDFGGPASPFSWFGAGGAFDCGP